MRKRKIRRLRKPIYKKGIFWLLIFLPFIFGVFVWFLFFSNFFMIEKISISGIKEKEKIENLIIENSKNNFLKRKNIFLFNSKKIESQILNHFPEIKSVEILKKFPDEILVKLKKRAPLFLFCNKTCCLIDEEGVCFKESKNENFLKIELEGKEELTIGESIISKEEIEKILKIKKELENLKISCEKVIISQEKTDFLTKDGWKLIFSFEKDVEFQLKKLKIAWENLEKEKKEILEYLDLRFENFVVPKYKTTQ